MTKTAVNATARSAGGRSSGAGGRRLHDILGEFAKRGLNLTKVESRPKPERPWTYVFQVDVEGHREDPVLSETLADLIPKVSSMKVLGSYPTWESIVAQGRRVPQ
mgnify:CR=1 FL=1